MKIHRSILYTRFRAMICFLVGVCVSPVLAQWSQVSILGARANEYGVFVQEPGAGKNPIAKQTLPTQPAGETALPDAEKEGIDETIPSEPKKIVRLFLDCMRKNDQSKMRLMLSSRAQEEQKRKQIEIAPIDSAKVTFRVLDAVEDGDSTLVKSNWEVPKTSSDTSTPGESKSFEVVLELRKELRGWRICGMAVDGTNGSQIQVIDFENLELPNVVSDSAIFRSLSTKSMTSNISDSDLHSDPKTITKLFVEAVARRDVAQIWALLSTKARAEIKWSDNKKHNEYHVMQAICFNGGRDAFVVSENEPIKQDGCMLVSSKWENSIVASPNGIGKDIVWKLRWESKGWRIFGYVSDPFGINYSRDFEQPVPFETVDQKLGSETNERYGGFGQANRLNPTTNSPTTIYPPSLPTIQNLPSAPQDFELDAEIVSEIKAIVTLSADRNGNTIYQISKLREVILQSIAHSDSGLETYAQIQEVLNRTVTWYQAEKDETSRTELHASAIKLAKILFHLQQLKRKSEIGGIEKRLGKLKEIVATREKMSEQIVNSRVNQLLGISDGMGWEDLEVREPQTSPFTLR
jgi:hypothetical protein